MGAVYWITGLSGAGKTTIGKIVYEKLKEIHSNTVFLDGDTLRQVFDEDLGYEEPLQPDLTLQNDGQNSPEEQAQMILSHIYKH